MVLLNKSPLDYNFLKYSIIIKYLNIIMSNITLYVYDITNGMAK